MLELVQKEQYPADVCSVVEDEYDFYDRSDILSDADLDIFEANYGFFVTHPDFYPLYITERYTSHTAVYINKDSGDNNICLGLYGCTDEDSYDNEVFVARNIYTPEQVLAMVRCFAGNARTTIDIRMLLDAIATLCFNSGFAFSDLNAVLTHLHLGGLYPFDINPRIQTSIKPKVIWLN